MNKTETIRSLVNAGRAADVRELLLGVSRYCLPDIEASKWSNEAEQLRQMAEVHLDFLAKYGAEVEQIQDGKFHRFSYPPEFAQWLALGAPGVEVADLEAYLSANPIS